MVDVFMGGEEEKLGEVVSIFPVCKTHGVGEGMGARRGKQSRAKSQSSLPIRLSLTIYPLHAEEMPH